MENNFKRYRIKNGYTQKEISSLLNMPYRTYQNYEEGKTNCPKWLKDLIFFRLNSIKKYDYDRGIYTLKQIKYIAIPLFIQHKIDRVYLIGDYINKSIAESSKLEFFIDSEISLSFFYQLENLLEESFNKKIVLYEVIDYDKEGEFVKNVYKKGIIILNLKYKTR